VASHTILSGFILIRLSLIFAGKGRGSMENFTSLRLGVGIATSSSCMVLACRLSVAMHRILLFSCIIFSSALSWRIPFL
jgi:hypothetical protein